MTAYNPPRRKPKTTGDPLEIDLVYNVRPCGSCSFFWPEDATQQPYGPFPAYDFDSNTPQTVQPTGNPRSYVWVKGATRSQAFPNPEIMDGCRKAPIMTIGINPNLTAFAPGTTGASWCYPNFTSENATDAWTKYAYYYRYRSVYQERFQLDFVKRYLLNEGKVTASKTGIVVGAQRSSDAPSFDIEVKYDGDAKTTKIPVQWKLNEPRYVLLFDHYPPGNRFAAGDVLAARLDVPAGEAVEVYQQQIGYYEQFVPTLDRFQELLRGRGHADANLRIGEDVCQLDMVACASPHWKPSFLGGEKSELAVIDNCVRKNAWAMKQFVQTRPAVLYLVGEASWNMFNDAFGALIKRDPPVSRHPVDGAFTLLHETTDPERPCRFEFETTIDGLKYSVSTRLVATPHFSYKTNFMPQFRMSGEAWHDVQKAYPACAKFLKTDPRLKVVEPPSKGEYLAIRIDSDAAGVFSTLENTYTDALPTLLRTYYNPHKDMAKVLEDLYDNGTLSYTAPADGKSGFLTRTEGSCQFCVNRHWSFPLGCPYEKTEIEPPPAAYLEKVADAIVAAGQSGDG